ncbi:type II-A CRISPR-associated protein Csn2 [Periweissella cryptocerci]|uniref:Type II-A CRISPR-associated protein Csn2 n=1 Tax=Periweissella cryptocerci TaxID=2506420 RepID=A0A4P6YVT3_9LACO|nr:type II-A CRISPR-associated protein Csn2 [Periweissella cryptocerci]QBO36924.1 type II-A CRISPR-associated protein Csn2 [Periweissella cryptocerci]
MKYLVTTFPYQPVEIEGLTVLGISDTQLYWQILNGLLDPESEKVIVSINDKVVKKEYRVLGDIAGISEVSSLFKKQAMSKLTAYLDEHIQQRMFEIDCEIKTMLWQVISESDLPLEITDGWDVGNVLKAQNINVSSLETGSGYDKMDSIINIASELSDTSLLIFSNVHLYLSLEQIDYLFEDIKQKELSVLFLEKTTSKLRLAPEFADNNHFIDDDFVQL